MVYSFALTGRHKPSFILPRVSLRLPWARFFWAFSPFTINVSIYISISHSVKITSKSLDVSYFAALIIRFFPKESSFVSMLLNPNPSSISLVSFS